MKFRDVQPEWGFIDDWYAAPKKVQRRVDRKILMYAAIGFLPPSAQAHKAHTFDDAWIVYVHCGKAAWRMLVRYEDDMLKLLRLLDHEDMLQLLNGSN